MLFPRNRNAQQRKSGSAFVFAVGDAVKAVLFGSAKEPTDAICKRKKLGMRKHSQQLYQIAQTDADQGFRVRQRSSASGALEPMTISDALH